MSPRPYRMGQRQAAVEQTRARMLAAARAVLTDPSGYQAFTVDAVARQADVARPTVYYQFGSKLGLIEALCDDLGARGRMDDLAAAFSEPDPMAGLERLVVVFSRFWASDRAVTRRLRALAVLDPDIGQVIGARDDGRRQAIDALVGRLEATSGQLDADVGQHDGTVGQRRSADMGKGAGQDAGQDGAAGQGAAAGQGTGHGAGQGAGAVVAILTALTSFETFDSIAGSSAGQDRDGTAGDDADRVARAIVRLLPAVLAMA